MKKVLFVLMILYCCSINAQWQRAGVTGKSLRDIVVKNNKIFAVTYSDGVYESADNGVTWTQHLLPASSGNIMKMIVNGTNLFIATTSQLLKSTDDGNTWNNIRDGSNYGLAVNSQYLFLAVYGSGVFRSSDSGIAWEIKNNGLSKYSCLAIAAEGAKVVLGTSESGVYYSDNNGESWTLKNNGLPANVNVRPLLIEGNNIWIYSNSVSGNYLYKSTDNGDNWSLVNGIEGSYSFIFKKDANYITAGGKYVMKSNDSGINWSNFHYGLTNDYGYGCVELSNNLFLTTSDGVWKRPYSEINLTVPNAPVANSAASINSSGFTVSWNLIQGVTNYYIDVSINEQFTSLLAAYSNKDVGNLTSYEITGLAPKTDYYFRVKARNSAGYGNVSNTIKVTTLVPIPVAPVLTTNNVFTQTSAKITWNGVVGAEKYFVDVSSSNTFGSFVTGYENKDVGNVTSTYVYGLQPNTQYFVRVRSYNTNGTSQNSTVLTVTTRANEKWIQTTGPSKTAGGPANTAVRYFITVDNTLYAAAYGATGLFKTTDNGNNWIKVFDCTNDVVNLFNDGNNIYASTNGSGVYISEDKGLTWQQRNSGLGNLKVYSLWKSGNNLYGATFGDGIFVSANNGNSWTSINNGLSNKFINTIYASGANLFAGSSSAGIFISNNGGTSWTQSSLTGRNIIVIKGTSSKLYAVTWGSGVYISSDNGANWTQINSGMGSNLNCLIFTRHTDNDLFITTENAIYYSKNGGSSWENLTDNFPAVAIWSIEVQGNYIFAGTSELGVFKRTLTEVITSVDENKEIPAEFNLFQNYPNPFNPTTSIKYSVPKNSLVKIQVFDILGREVAQLVNQEKQPGNYETKFNASNLTSGIYLYRLQVGSYSQIKKMILIK